MTLASESFDGDREIGEQINITVGGHPGYLVYRGNGSFEAFNDNNASLGRFADEDDAGWAVFECGEKLQTNSDNAHAIADEDPSQQPKKAQENDDDQWSAAPESLRKGAGNGGNPHVALSEDLGLPPEQARETDETDWDALAAARNGGDSQPPMLAAALGLAKQRGWKTFPARMEDGKKYSWLSAKHAPGGENWGMTNDPEQLQRNFTNPKWRSKCGVGVPTGWVNRIFDVETDTPAGHNVDGEAALRKLEAEHGPLPDTLMAISPSGSKHRIYNHPGHGIKVISRGLPGYPGIDIKGDGGMFVAPPSMRSDGVYRWLNDLPMADAPQWLIDLVTSKSNGKGTDNGDGEVPLESPEFPPVSFDPIKEGCGWLRHVHNTNGADQKEILWRDALRVCMFLEQGERLIHELSSGHAGYDAEKTEAKFEEVRKAKEDKDLGYPKCQTICDHGSTHCKTCPQFSKGRSPLNLALRRRPLLFVDREHTAVAKELAKLIAQSDHYFFNGHAPVRIAVEIDDMPRAIEVTAENVRVLAHEISRPVMHTEKGGLVDASVVTDVANIYLTGC